MLEIPGIKQHFHITPPVLTGDSSIATERPYTIRLQNGPSWPVEIVTTAEALAKAVAKMRTESNLGIDTEYYGWESGQPKLRLLQVALNTAQRIFVIDHALVTDLSALLEPLKNPAIRKYGHGMLQDYKALRGAKLSLKGEIDTLDVIRSIRPDLPNKSFQTACRHILRREVSKALQSSDFQNAALSEAQYDYAALDAENALELGLALERRLDLTGVDSNLTDVRELMRHLYLATNQLGFVQDEFAERLATLDITISKLSQAINARTSTSDENYDGLYGRCGKAERSRDLELDPWKLVAAFPEVAKSCLIFTTNQGQLNSYVNDSGQKMYDLAKDSPSSTPVKVEVKSESEGGIIFGARYDKAKSGATASFRLPADTSLEEMMKTLAEATFKRLCLLKETSEQIELLKILIRNLTERISHLVRHDGKKYRGEGEFGTAILIKPLHYELKDPIEFIQRHPMEAREILNLSVDSSRLNHCINRGRIKLADLNSLRAVNYQPKGVQNYLSIKDLCGLG